MLGISTRGDSSWRTLLIHGARVTLRWVGLKTDRRSQWMRQRLECRGKNRTAVAVANKNARIVWALLTGHQDYQPVQGERRGRAWEPRGLCSPHGGRRPGDERWQTYDQLLDLSNDKEKPSRTMRGVIEVMTRSVRPPSSNPDEGQGP